MPNQRIFWVLLLSLLSLTFYSGCKTSEVDRKPSEESVERRSQHPSMKQAIVWSSPDGIHIKSHLIGYTDDGNKVVELGTADKLYIWAGDALWTLKSTKYKVNEGNCQTKGGVTPVEKEGYYLRVVGGSEGKSHKQLGVTDPHSVPNATFKTDTKIIGSFEQYIFSLVCTEYQYCSYPHEYPECEFVGYDLLNQQQVMTDDFVKEYPFTIQAQDIFPKILSKGGEILGDRYPLYVQPVWNQEGIGNWEAYYRVRVRKGKRKKIYYEETTRKSEKPVGTKLNVENMPAPLVSFAAGGKYSGFSLIDHSSVDLGKYFVSH